MTYRLSILNSDFDAARDRMRVLAVLGVVGHPIFYFIWLIWFPQTYESVAARGLFIVMAVLWLIWDRFDKDSNSAFRNYSYSVLTVGFPFFFTYMYLMNEGSSIWLGSLICGILYLALIVDFLTFVILTAIGSSIAIALVVFSGFPSHVGSTFLSHIPVVSFAFIGGVGFKYLESMTIQKNRDNAIALAGSIAHELRTPILGIRLELEALDDVLDKDETSIEVKETLSMLQQHHSKSSYIIDRLLQNVQRGRIDQTGFRNENMGQLIEDLIKRYPFFPGQKKLVSWNQTKNFTFFGDGFLMSQVIMNLIENALRSVAAAEKGIIKIEMSEDSKYNILHIEDTGLGMHAKERALMFERFYSKTPGGAGLGLAFCQRVIMSFNGKILVDSEPGSFTRISMHLPKDKVLVTEVI